MANSILAYNSSGNENLELNAMLTIEKNNVKHEDSDSKEEKSIKEVDEIYDYLLENHFKRSDFFDEKKEKLSNLVGEGYEEFVFKVNSLSESAYQQLLSLFDGDKEVKFSLLDEKERGSISIKIKNDSCSKIRNLKYHFVLFHYCISSQRAL